MSFSKNKTVNRIMLVIISLLVSVLLIEIGMRVFGIWSPKQFHLIQPNSELRDVQSHWDITYKTNSLGFRDKEYIAGDKPEDVKTRIVTIGDSFTFGQGVARDEIFPDIIEANLSTKENPVEVINISNIGIGPESYYYLLKDQALQFKPDIIILNVYANDVSKTIEESESKKMIKRLSQNSHILTFLRDILRKSRIKKNKKKEQELSITYRKGDKANQKSFFNEYKKKYGSKTTNLITAILADPKEVARWVNVRPEGPGWKEFNYYLEKMNLLCKNSGCILIIGIIPDGAQVDPIQLEIRQTLGVPLDKTVLTEQGDFQILVSELAQTQGLPYFDPLTEFRKQTDVLYFESDLHWTPRGHKLYAEQLIKFLKKHNFISSQ